MKWWYNNENNNNIILNFILDFILNVVYLFILIIFGFMMCFLDQDRELRLELSGVKERIFKN